MKIYLYVMMASNILAIIAYFTCLATYTYPRQKQVTVIADLTGLVLAFVLLYWACALLGKI